MTPSISLAPRGFLQGLQAEVMWLIAAIIAVVILLLLVRWCIGKLADTQQKARSARRVANGVASVVALLVLVAFCLNAATYATNAIPRSGLDRSSIDEQMNFNIKH
jgi:hypothetical protein